MERELNALIWKDMSVRLKEKYPSLTSSDLLWRHSSIEDLLEMIACKLGISFRDLKAELSGFHVTYDH